MSSFRLKWLLTCCYIDDFVVYIKKISIHGHLFNCVTLNAPYSNTFTWSYSLHTFYLSCPPPSRYLYIVYIVATGKSIGNVCSRLSTNLLAIHVTISHTYMYMCVLYWPQNITLPGRTSSHPKQAQHHFPFSTGSIFSRVAKLSPLCEKLQLRGFSRT